MAYKTLSMEEVVAFRRHLEAQERSAGTVENYLRHVSAFARWLDGRPVTKENAAGWKGYLTGGKYRPATVNAMLASLNQFFLFTGRQDCRVKPLRLQRRLFREEDWSGKNTTACCRPPSRKGGNGWRCCWRPSAPQASGSLKWRISQWRPPGKGRQRSSSKGRSGSFCCPKSCAANCCGMPKNKKPFLVKCSSPKTAILFPANRSGPK